MVLDIENFNKHSFVIDKSVSLRLLFFFVIINNIHYNTAQFGLDVDEIQGKDNYLWKMM